MATVQYSGFAAVTTLADADIFPLQAAADNRQKKITWANIKAALSSWILLLVHPVGSYYVQYPAASSNDADIAFPSAYSPASLFGGTWELIYNTEGIVFQTEGYDGAGRTDGLMEDQAQGHKHYTTIEQSNNSGSGHYTTLERAFQYNINYNTSDPISDGTNGTPRTGTRTSHRNRLMRVYRRTA